MKKWIFFLLILLMSCTAVGCEKQIQTAEKEPGVYQIYYLNVGNTKLVAQDYRAQAEDIDGLAAELLTQIRVVPKDLDCQSVIPDKVELRRYHREDMVLYLYFDDAYTSMETTGEILCRAALAKTLTQIDGIDFINIYAGEQPLLDGRDAPVGMLAGSDFVDNITDVNAYEKTEMKLFFADKKGEKLLQEKREVVHNVNTSLEKLLIEQLIMGPTIGGLYPTLPQDVKLLSVTVNENTCYINFDAAFLNSTLEVKEYIPIYSIVNSLSELSTVNKVQISINGAKDVKFRDAISLDTLFERNLDYIGGDNN